MPSRPLRTDCPLPNGCIAVHPVASCALEAFFSPCVSPLLHAQTLSSQHVLSMNKSPAWEAQPSLAIHLPKTHQALKATAQPPYITSAQWRPSGTGKSLLCIAVLQCRSISSLRRCTHPHDIRTKFRQKSHAHSLLRCRSYLWGRNGEISLRCLAWHTWTRTASSPQPTPSRVRVPSEWTFLLEESVGVTPPAGRIRLRLVRDRRMMGGMRASCGRGE